MLVEVSVLLLALVLSASPAQAGCEPIPAEERPGAAPGTRVQTLGFRLAEGWPDCARVEQRFDPARPLLDLELRVTDANGRLRALPAAPRLSWQGTEDDPRLRLDLPELRPGGQVELRLTRGDATAAPVPRPAADPPQVAMVSLLPRRKPLRALAQDGEATTAWLLLREGALPAVQTRPPQARAAFCQLLDEGKDCAPLGPWAWSLPERGRVRVGWLVDRVEPAGSFPLQPGQAFHWALPESSPLLDGPRGLRLEEAPGAGALGLGAAFDGPLPSEWVALLAASLPPRLHLLARNPTPEEARLLYRIEALDDRPVLPDRRTAEQLVAWQALRASIPEPSLPQELRGLRPDPAEPPDAAISLVKTFLDEELHPGALPGRPPLSPRPLMKVLRSGWATPWEHALVLARALRQLRLDALPLPVRPAALGPPDPASLADWPEALVLVRHPAGPLLVDPGCRSCAPGQVRPLFDRAWVLSPGLERLPALPASLVQLEVRGEELRVELAGPAALALREEVLAVSPERRADFLAERLLGRPARLLQHEGLVHAEERLVLRFAGAQRRPLPESCLLFGPLRGRCVEVDEAGRRLEIEVGEPDAGTAAFVRAHAASALIEGPP